MSKEPLNEGKNSIWSSKKSLKAMTFGFIALVVLALAGFAADVATSSSKFCLSCHEMSPEVHTWEASTHANVDCVSCHTDSGFLGKFKEKSDRFSEAYKSWTNTQMDPIKLTDARKIPNERCESCHSIENRPSKQKGDIIFSHEQHRDASVSCVTCHHGVVHGQIAERGLNGSDTYGSWDREAGMMALKQKEFRVVQKPACLSCHEDSSVPNTCGSCHSTGMRPPDHDKPNFISKLHGEGARKDLAGCDSCHKFTSVEDMMSAYESNSTAAEFLNDKKDDESAAGFARTLKEYVSENDFCSSCHSIAPASHEGDFFAKHGTLANENKAGCLTCHDETANTGFAPSSVSCGSCHNGRHDSYDWRRQHPTTPTPPTRLEASCYSCHAQTTCQSCHLPSQAERATMQAEE